MIPHVSALIALLLMTASGEGLLLLLRIRSGGTAERVGASVGVGTGIVATWSFLLALLSIGATPILLALPVLLYPLGRIFGRTVRENGGGPPRRLPRDPLSIGLALIVAAQSAYVVRHAILRPVHGWDAWKIWSFRAKVLFVEGGFTPDFFSHDWAGFPGYPLGIPFVEAYIARAIGYWHGPAIKIFFPVCFALLLLFVFRLLRETAGPVAARIGLLLLLSAPLLVHHGTVAYMDLPLAAFLVASVFFLVRWEKRGGNGTLLLAAMHAGFLVQIKNEGLAFYLLLTLLFVLRARSGGSFRGDLVRWFAASLPFALPWLLFKYGTGVPESPHHTFAFAGSSVALARLAEILRLALTSMTRTGSWGIAWFTLLFLLVPGRRKGSSLPALVLGGGALLFLASYLLTGSYVFIVNGTALGRNLLVLLPLAVTAGLSALFPPAEIDN